MNRRDLERLRDLLQPLPSECDGPCRTFGESLATFHELVNAIARAQELGMPVHTDLEDLVVMLQDLAEERERLERACMRLKRRCN